MSKDKNGVELKVGDMVYHSDHPDELSLITYITVDGSIELDRGGYYISEYLIKIQEARTYTEAEMEQCFMAGFRHCLYIECDSIGSFVPDFQEFIQSLNTPKP